MLRTIANRLVGGLLLAGVLGLSSLTTSCGGGGYAAKDMVLVELLFVDRSLTPTAPTGTLSLPRNAMIMMVFSELVDPGSVNNQTIQLRFGANFQSVPTGSFSVDGNKVIFDPTVTALGEPNPEGFLPVTQYILDIPGFEEQQGVVRNLDDDPLLNTFFTQFTTAAGWLRELVPPQVVDVFFVPAPDLLTGNIPGNGIMGIQFNEPMRHDSFILGPSVGGPDVTTTVDVRYTNDTINVVNGLGLTALPGSFEPDKSLQNFFFRPTFSFGDKKLIFTVQVFQGCRDLSGNLLINPRSFGPYTCDGKGIASGKTIDETFLNTCNMDGADTDADWGSTEEGVLLGQPISSREALIFTYPETDNGSNSGRGQYAPIVDPLTGQDLNLFVPNVSPPTADGRRVMWSFSDLEMGPKGSVTAAKWGPDSNATFAALYPTLKIRMGFQATNSMTLAPNFSGNYEGQPALVYQGSYLVQQKANVGNTPGEPQTAHVPGYPQNPGCTAINPWNKPLFDFTGFVNWPALTNFFEWNPGTGAPAKVFVFDVSCVEGDSFQQLRGWFGVTFPCSGVLIGGLPLRRMYATYEENVPNPASNFAAGIQNPEQSLTDSAFTITRRVSQAQTLFYGPPGVYPAAGGCPAPGATFGPDTDYLPAQLNPAVQAGGATVEVFFQGASVVEADRRTINQAAPFTGWTKNINDLDGFGYIRVRIVLNSNLISLAVPRLNDIILPMIQN